MTAPVVVTVMYMHSRAAIMVISFVMPVVMLRAVMLAVMPRAVLSDVVPRHRVFSVVVAVTEVMVPVYFVMNVASVWLALIAVTVAVSCQCRPRPPKSQCN